MRGELEARLRRFDGEYRWFLHRAEPLRDELGNIVKWYGSSTDIEDASEPRWRFEKANSAFAIMRNGIRLVSGRPDRATGSPAYRITSTLLASRPGA